MTTNTKNKKNKTKNYTYKSFSNKESSLNYVVFQLEEDLNFEEEISNLMSQECVLGDTFFY